MVLKFLHIYNGLTGGGTEAFGSVCGYTEATPWVLTVPSGGGKAVEVCVPVVLYVLIISAVGFERIDGHLFTFMKY